MGALRAQSGNFDRLAQRFHPIGEFLLAFSHFSPACRDIFVKSVSNPL